MANRLEHWLREIVKAALVYILTELLEMFLPG